MPVSLNLSHIILEELARIRKKGQQMTYLRPDSKSQVTIEYSEKNKPIKIIVLLFQLNIRFDQEELMLKKIKDDIQKVLIPR